MPVYISGDQYFFMSDVAAAKFKGLLPHANKLYPERSRAKGREHPETPLK